MRNVLKNEEIKTVLRRNPVNNQTPHISLLLETGTHGTQAEKQEENLLLPNFPHDSSTLVL